MADAAPAGHIDPMIGAQRVAARFYLDATESDWLDR
jgi:hypothetical protein